MTARTRHQVQSRRVAWARRLLGRLAPPPAREAIEGDFEEGFSEVAAARGLGAAAWWFWSELVRSAPALVRERLLSLLERSGAVNPKSFFASPSGPVVVGLVGMIPAAFLFATVFIQFGLGDEALADKLARLAHPVPLMLGLMLASVLNALTILRVRYSGDAGGLVAVLRLRGRWRNVVVLAASVLMITVILAYLVAENYRFVPTHTH